MIECNKKQNISEVKLKTHGTISISIIFTALIIGFLSIFEYSLPFSILYVGAILLFLFLVGFIYCSKCLSRDNCNHLFMGSLSKLISPYKKGKYTKFDIIVGVVLPMLIIYILPQFWLYKNIYYMVSFWVLTLIGLIDVVIVVCVNCSNTKCMLCKNKHH